MTSAGLVSVMMPAYNAATYVGEAIDSLLAQSYANWELLVVNDGSTDATADVVGRYRDRDPRIRLISQENGGESSARNVALDQSTGEFIAYLDADDAYLPHHLAATVEFLRANPHRDAVYTDGLHIDEHGNRLASLQSRRRGPFEGNLFEHAVLASDIFGPPLCVVLRHETLARTRPRYDTRITIGPDWEFFIRFTERASYGYLDDRTCLYRVHQTNISTRVAADRKTASLILCREKAIKLESFAACSAEMRVKVFYDLLVDLLHDQPSRREAVTGWSEFADLPAGERARLLRLMASETILYEADHSQVMAWLQRARALNPSDGRARLLAGLYRVSPRLCQAVLRAKSPARTRDSETAPFADLFGDPAGTVPR